MVHYTQLLGAKAGIPGLIRVEVAPSLSREALFRVWMVGFMVAPPNKKTSRIWQCLLRRQGMEISPREGPSSVVRNLWISGFQKVKTIILSANY